MDRIGDFLMLLRELQKIDPEFPLQYAVCLGVISLREGMSISCLAEETGLSLSTVSRIVGALSTARQRGEAYGLVRTKISVNERRRKELYLTPKGRLFIESIDVLLGGAGRSGKSTAAGKPRIASAV